MVMCCAPAQTRLGMWTAPVVDLAKHSAAAPCLDAVAADIDAALRSCGLFFVVNHGVSKQLVDRVWKFVRCFHAAPNELKAAGGFRTCLSEYGREIDALAHRLLTFLDRVLL